ncbi:MAG: type 4a pilus biogenesis protein PilO [Planctomycetota bacterium]
MQPPQSIHPKLFVVLTHVVGALLVALLICGFMLLAFQPMKAKQVADDERAGVLRGLLENSIEVRRQHVQLKTQLEELSARIERSRELTPVQSKESEFLATASRIAEAQGLEIEDYRRGKVRRLLAHSELDITLNAIGGHQSICGFLSEMEADPRAKRVHRLAIESADSPRDYPMEVSYTLYFGLETSKTASTGAMP